MTTASLAADFLNSADGSESPAVAQLPAELAQLIVAHRANVLDIVKASSEFLTSDDDKRRGRGLSLLARVVSKCPKDAATRQETRTLAEFFISCISSPLTEDVFVPTLEGLTSLAKLPHFGASDTTNLCRAMFKHVDLHGRPQTTRFLVYCLVDALMANHRQALKRMGKEFLSGYCHLVTGEKDPRNLRLAFSIERVMLVEFDIAENVEDLFDIIFCYFPITFTPPPNDPYGISSEQLQMSLRGCLSATPRFGSLALPLFIEKLQASTSSAKRQTLEALVACFPVYGRAVIVPHALIFWESLSVEIFHATDAETEASALKALRVLLATLFPDSLGSIPEDKARAVLEKIEGSCLLELKQADKSNATPATKVLGQALSASGLLADYFVPKVFTHILETYKLPDEVHQRSALFKILGQLIKSLRDCPVARPSDTLAPFREEILSLAATGIKANSTQEQALFCLAQLAEFPDCLPREELTFAIQCMTDLLVRPPEDSDEEATALALDALESLARLHPSEIEEITLPPLVQLLPDSAPSQNNKDAITEYKLGLAGLATLCVQPALFESFLIRILSRVELLCSASVPNKEQYAQTVLYAHHLLTTLRVVISKKIEANHLDIQACASRVSHRLFSLFLRHISRYGNSPAVATSMKLIEDAGKIVTLLVQQMDERAQRSLMAELQAAYIHGKVQTLSPDAATSDVRFGPFKDGAPNLQRNLGVMYAHALYGMKKEVFDSGKDLNDFGDTILSQASSTSDGHRNEVFYKLLASTVNKKAESLVQFLDTRLPVYWNDEIASSSRPTEQRKGSLSAYTWIMRGLMFRSDNRAYQGISKIVDLFADADINHDAARTMLILSMEKDGVITKSNHAVIRLLYKQRFYSFIMPKLIQGYHSAESGKGTAYLIGLSCLLQNMPKQTTVAELPKLLPLLLRALDLPELDLRANVVDTLALLVKDTPEAIKGHAESIVSNLLRNATSGHSGNDNDTDAAANLRIAALKCLTVFPDSLDWLTLHQQKQPVLKALAIAVDDPKKRVRRVAVDCRARWYLFKAP